MKIVNLLLIVVFVFFACDEISNLGSGDAGISIKIPRSIPNKLAKKADHIKIDKVKILIDRIKLHKAANDSLNFADGPFIIELDSNLNFKQIALNNIANGSYNQVSFKIHKPDSGEILADTSFTANGGRYSLIVSGIVGDSANFTYRFDQTVTQKLFIEPPFTINGEGQYNVTILVDTETWFLDNSTELNPLDPGDSNKIQKNIKSSFKAFKDNNRDGSED